MNRDAPELAVLIDSDNAQAAVFSELLAAVAQLGTTTVKGVCGNWTTPQRGSWREVLNCCTAAAAEPAPPGCASVPAPIPRWRPRF